MQVPFAIAAAVAVIATLLALSRANSVHGLLYFVISLIASASVFWMLGATYAAALEVILYAGAVVVLFVFVVMLLAHGPERIAEERSWLDPRAWVGPSVLAAALLLQVALVLVQGVSVEPPVAISPQAVGSRMYGPYLIAVEAASFLLLAGVVGAWHLGRPD